MTPVRSSGAGCGCAGPRQRIAAVAVGTLVLALSVSSIMTVQAWRSERPTGPAATTPAAPSPAVSLSAPQRFIPATRTENGRVIMPVTFLDGTTAEIVYPGDLDLAGMGADPSAAAHCTARRSTAAHGISTSHTANRSASHSPVRCSRSIPEQTEDPFVCFEDSPRADRLPGLRDRRVAAWASGITRPTRCRTSCVRCRSAHLRGRVSADGFPVLTSTPPVRLTPLGKAVRPITDFRPSQRQPGGVQSHAHVPHRLCGTARERTARRNIDTRPMPSGVVHATEHHRRSGLHRADHQHFAGAQRPLPLPHDAAPAALIHRQRGICQSYLVASRPG